MRRLFKKIHLWLAIPTGLIIFIICITGAILSFETEILEAYYPERYFTEDIKEKPIPLDQLTSIVNKQLKDNTVSSIKVTADPHRTYIATLTEGFRVSAFVNPYTGELKGIYSYRDGFFFKMMSLHRWLMDGTRTWGKYTVGITTLLFVLILISGIIWWIPTKKKHLKHKLKVKTSNGIKRLLHDMHSVLGMYACLFLLVCSLTGLMWSFDWYRNGVNKLFGVETSSENRRSKKEKDENKEINYQNWNIVLEKLQKQVKDYKYITISEGTATVLATSAPHLRATDQYSFDNSTGKIDKTSYYSERKDSNKIMTWAYALHVGAYGGIVFRILTCIACIIGATLPLTGYYIFFKKKKKKKKS